MLAARLARTGARARRRRHSMEQKVWNRLRTTRHRIATDTRRCMCGIGVQPADASVGSSSDQKQVMAEQGLEPKKEEEEQSGRAQIFWKGLGGADLAGRRDFDRRKWRGWWMADGAAQQWWRPVMGMVGMGDPSDERLGMASAGGISAVGWWSDSREMGLRIRTPEMEKMGGRRWWGLGPELKVADWDLGGAVGAPDLDGQQAGSSPRWGREGSRPGIG